MIEQKRLGAYEVRFHFPSSETSKTKVIAISEEDARAWGENVFSRFFPEIRVDDVAPATLEVGEDVLHWTEEAEEEAAKLDVLAMLGGDGEGT